jgi:hypothetical protein
VQFSRLYGESFPYYSDPGIFYFDVLYSALPVDSAPIRAVTPQSFQRYEDDILTGANLWMTYRRVEAFTRLAGTFALNDTLFDGENQPLTRREVLELNRGGSFRSREYYGGVLAVETVSDSWLQPGPYVFAVNPRRRFYDTTGAPGEWNTLSGDWVLSLRGLESNSFEKLDVYSWYDEFLWATYRRETGASVKAAALARTGAPAASVPRPARFGSAGLGWNRSAFPPAGAGAGRTPFPGRTSLRPNPAGGSPPRAPSR